MDYRASSRAFVNRSLAATAGILDGIETDVNEARQIVRSNNASFRATENVIMMLKEEIKLLKEMLENKTFELKNFHNDTEEQLRELTQSYEEQMEACNGEIDRVLSQCNNAIDGRNALALQLSELKASTTRIERRLVVSENSNEKLAVENKRLVEENAQLTSKVFEVTEYCRLLEGSHDEMSTFQRDKYKHKLNGTFESQLMAHTAGPSSSSTTHNERNAISIAAADKEKDQLISMLHIRIQELEYQAVTRNDGTFHDTTQYNSLLGNTSRRPVDNSSSSAAHRSAADLSPSPSSPPPADFTTSRLAGILSGRVTATGEAVQQKPIHLVNSTMETIHNNHSQHPQPRITRDQLQKQIVPTRDDVFRSSDLSTRPHAVKAPQRQSPPLPQSKQLQHSRTSPSSSSGSGDNNNSSPRDKLNISFSPRTSRTIANNNKFSPSHLLEEERESVPHSLSPLRSNFDAVNDKAHWSPTIYNDIKITENNHTINNSNNNTRIAPFSVQSAYSTASDYSHLTNNMQSLDYELQHLGIDFDALDMRNNKNNNNTQHYKQLLSPPTTDNHNYTHTNNNHNSSNTNNELESSSRGSINTDHTINADDTNSNNIFFAGDGEEEEQNDGDVSQYFNTNYSHNTMDGFNDNNAHDFSDANNNNNAYHKADDSERNSPSPAAALREEVEEEEVFYADTLLTSSQHHHDNHKNYHYKHSDFTTENDSKHNHNTIINYDEHDIYNQHIKHESHHNNSDTQNHTKTDHNHYHNNNNNNHNTTTNFAHTNNNHNFTSSSTTVNTTAPTAGVGRDFSQFLDLRGGDEGDDEDETTAEGYSFAYEMGPESGDNNYSNHNINNVSHNNIHNTLSYNNGHSLTQNSTTNNISTVKKVPRRSYTVTKDGKMDYNFELHHLTSDESQSQGGHDVQHLGDRMGFLGGDQSVLMEEQPYEQEDE